MKVRALKIATAAFVGLVCVWVTPVLGATPTCGLHNGQAAKGKPIEIGAIVSATGLDDFNSSAKAARAYFKCVNDNGGINGRRWNIRSRTINGALTCQRKPRLD